MNKTLFLIGAACNIAVSALAENTFNDGNSYNRIEAEETVSIKVPEINGNCRDSIPYLLEHARNQEPWAYEALGDCYRYGKGVEKSITNALIYYDEGNVKARDFADKAYESDPADELGFMNHLMEELDKNRMTIEEAVSLIEKYPAPIPQWAVRMKTIFENKDVDDLEGYIKSLVDLNSDSADELVASIACMKILKPDTPSIIALPPTPEVMRILTLAAHKIPMLFNIAADKYLELYEDCPNDEQAMKNAFKLYHEAYQHGLMQPRGAVEILDYRDNNQLYEGFPFTKEEMENLDRFYSKEYRIHFKSPRVFEEAVEYDENPVVLESEAYE